MNFFQKLMGQKPAPVQRPSAAGTWLIEDKLYSLFDDTVRVEIGPQVVELECNEHNLHNDVTKPHYKPGGRDARGHLIMPEAAGISSEVVNFETSEGRPPVRYGETMHCVDYKGHFVAPLWKVYQLQDTVDRNGHIVPRFIKVSEFVEFDDAVDAAQALGA